MVLGIYRINFTPANVDYISSDSDRGENLKEINYCHVKINMGEDNESISKLTHLFKLSQPFSRFPVLPIYD